MLLPIWFVAFAALFTVLNLRGVETSARINQALCAAMGLRVRSLRDRQVHDAKLAAWILLVAVVSVLLIACTDVATLLLARAASRHREMAVRSALGASRARLIRQTLTESLLLALIATTIGCIIARVLIRIFAAVAPEGIPFLATAHIDTGVIVFAVLASLLCGTLFGIAPALQRPNAESLAGRSNLAVPHSKLRQYSLWRRSLSASCCLPALDFYCAACGISKASRWACTPTVSSPPQSI